MIKHLFQNPKVMWQTADEDCGIPEPAIAICNDASGLVILIQEGREILINRASAKELARAITVAAKEDE